MNYSFDVKKDIIETNCEICLYSGNINTYTFSFNMDEEWNEYIKFGVFIKNGRSYSVKMDNMQIVVPKEVLLSSGDVSFGLFGTNGEKDIKRLSTNLITFKVNQGAYNGSDMPTPPVADFWETILSKYIPRIIDGKWYVYDINTDEYVDTGVVAEGVTPKKGVDYFTDEDIKNLELENREKISNKVTSLLDDYNSYTHEQYASAKAVIDYGQTLAKELMDIMSDCASKIYVEEVIQQAILNSWEAAV